jgi:S-sulfosulfanyl-L-cysteine sulfohydrolase
MEVTRRDLLRLAAIAGLSAGTTRQALADTLTPERLLAFEPLGNVTLLHFTDSHASLLPVYYREPDTVMGVGDERGNPPYLTGEALLRAYGFRPGTLEAYLFTHLDFQELTARYGKMGGYAHLATLVKRIRAERPGRSLLLDGGDSFQGSATSLWSRGEDMLLVSNQLGVDVCTGHWEFTYGADRVKEFFGDKEQRGRFAGDFIAHNVKDATWGERIFHPYTLREIGGARLGIIGQAFPYVSVSHPRRLISDLSFGIEEDRVGALARELREAHRVDLVVLLSHNGMAVDRKLAGRVAGVDVILGGHTHDAIPRPVVVGKTLLVSSGSHGKFLSRLDLDLRGRQIAAYRHKLIPVLSRAIPEDREMAALIGRIRAPHEQKLAEVLATSDSLLYRRGNFNGTFDELILDALLRRGDAQLALSPGFRWGVTLLSGQAITLEDVLAHTAITYPNTWVREMTGAEIQAILEDVADNLFHRDPYYRQGGDMVRVGGLTYAISVDKDMGQRISDIQIRGQAMHPGKKYKVTGWASLREADGPPAYDVVAGYLRSVKRVKIDPRPSVRIL